tara:strand:- start:1464 stop:1676 length:213 start_codon:yes stop_codon:yes gene_type:complete
VAAETHTIARRDRRWLLLTEEERVAICALLTCVDIVTGTSAESTAVWSRAPGWKLWIEAGKIRYFRTWVV